MKRVARYIFSRLMVLSPVVCLGLNVSCQRQASSVCESHQKQSMGRYDDLAPSFVSSPYPHISFVRFNTERDGYAAAAVFQLVNGTSRSYWYLDNGEPSAGMQGEIAGQWVAIPTFHCGTGLRRIELRPGTSKEFIESIPDLRLTEIRAISKELFAMVIPEGRLTGIRATLWLYGREEDSKDTEIFSDPARFSEMPAEIRQVYDHQK
jgi:hypothetical protein